ncbi:MAG: cofactor-independent phosphoglycerate mutase [Clostridia bacterium]|nr:cofactor-independent phosphoglycerate mutase [Clostridia bacterium]
MKYLIVIPDGMADEKIEALGNRTPMEAANKPAIDALAREAVVGTVSNVPADMVPESDTANLAILSYDPKIYSKGRSPLEAVSMGLEMAEDDTAYRTNVVTLSEDGEYEDKIMLDHSADEITTEEAHELILALDREFGSDIRRFHTGVSYRHCMLLKGGNDTYNFMRPHDIIGRRIGDYLPRAEDGGAEFLAMMRDSFALLNHHPINEARRARGLKPANSAWFWSPGRKPQLPNFAEKWGLKGTVISAVDLIKGIGLCAGMESVDVEGATGNVHTNYAGKAAAAIDAFARGQDLVYVHVEAPDECGHRAEIENKVRSVELIDSQIVAPVTEALRRSGEPFRVLILPDHPTPIRIRTHSIDPVPYLIYDSTAPKNGAACFTEDSAAAMQNYLPSGCELMGHFVRR